MGRFLLLQGNNVDRGTYWGAVAGLFVAAIIDNLLWSTPNVYAAFTIIVYYLFLCVACARCRAAGRSGWLALVTFIPLIGIIIIGLLETKTPEATPPPVDNSDQS